MMEPPPTPKMPARKPVSAPAPTMATSSMPISAIPIQTSGHCQASPTKPGRPPRAMLYFLDERYACLRLGGDRARLPHLGARRAHVAGRPMPFRDEGRLGHDRAAYRLRDRAAGV